MIRFLKTTAVFCLILAAVLVVADFLLSRTMQDAHTVGMEIWKDIMEGNANADILILGNSRAFDACDREKLDGLDGHRTYNLASVGNPFLVQRLRYNMYREHNRKPQLVILFVDEFSLGTTLSGYDPTQYYPWMWRKPFLREMLTTPFDNTLELLHAIIPFQRYRGSRPWNLFFQRQRFSQDGFKETALFPQHDFQPSTKRHEFVYLKETDDIFRDFLRRTTEEGIKVVFVLVPFHDSFLFKDGEKEKMRQYFEEVASESGIPIFDGPSLEIVHDSTLYLDSEHFNKKGSKVFSDSLARYLTGRGFID